MNGRILPLLTILFFIILPFSSSLTTFRWNSTHVVSVFLNNIIPAAGQYEFLADERPSSYIVGSDPIRRGENNVHYYFPSGRACVNIRDPYAYNAGPVSTSATTYFKSYSLLGYSGKCSGGIPSTNTSTVTISPYLPTWGKNPQQMTIQIEIYDDNHWTYVPNSSKKYRTKTILNASCSRSSVPSFYISSVVATSDMITYTFSYSYLGFCGLFLESYEPLHISLDSFLLALSFFCLLICSAVCFAICVVSGIILISCCSINLLISASKKSMKLLKDGDVVDPAALQLAGAIPSPLTTQPPMMPSPVTGNNPQFLAQPPQIKPMMAPPMQTQQIQLPQLPQFVSMGQHPAGVLFSPQQQMQQPQIMQFASAAGAMQYNPQMPMREEENVNQAMQYPATFEYPN